MARMDETMKYDADLTGVSDDLTLEEILAEYGGGREQNLMRDVEKELDPLREARPKEEKPLPPTPKKKKQEAPPPPPAAEPEFPKAPKPITLEEVVGSTVDAVMEENKEPLLKPRRGLFSRRKLEETEQLYNTQPKPEPEEVAEPIGPEPEFYETAAEERKAWQSGRNTMIPAALMALVPTVLLLAEEYAGVVIPMWTGDIRFQSIVILTCLALTAVLCRQVFTTAVARLKDRQCTAEVLAAVSAVVSAADCVVCMTVPARTAAAPYGTVAVLSLVFAQWGVTGQHRGMFDTFRTAAIDEQPPYLVTDTERGACKQQGAVTGFYTTAQEEDLAAAWQSALLPVVLAASLVFAGLSSLGLGRGADFLLNWSAILAAGATFALPLSWALPWCHLTRHLQRAGCAVAGWSGAEKISRRKCMIVTDTDLFPPGTIQLNGVKVYGEEMRVAVSHAATLAKAAGSGLERVFDGLLRSEGGRYEKLDDFSFYAEGGWSGTVRGESLLLGTASFMKKMDVRLPGDINLKTGVFLAVDRQLVAVFAVKYNASENVDYALRMMQRSHILPILASRDPNITPALLHRKFHKGVKVQYPDLTSRVALSEVEKDRDLPRALLFREGLLPYAEAVAGSRRLCQAVRRGVRLSLLGSIVGTLLAFYLSFMGAYHLMTALTLEAFLLLWVLPVLVMTDWTIRY